MPELPEVETVVRSVAPRLTGRRILEVRALSRLVVRTPLAPACGRRILAVRRHGKHILLELEGGAFLDIHLGMTGKLLATAGPAEPGPYTRALFALDDGGMLVYDDTRQFGRIEWSPALPARTARLGPDALAIEEDAFLLLVRARRSRIKPLLLNQAVLRGMGNIYTDEALFRARIHPRALASRLGPERARRLYRAMIDVLTEAVEHRGSSISDYVDADGRSGSFQSLHRVYGRAGLPCPACAAPIRRIVIAQRGTHYCPRCQRP